MFAQQAAARGSGNRTDALGAAVRRSTSGRRGVRWSLELQSAKWLQHQGDVSENGNHDYSGEWTLSVVTHIVGKGAADGGWQVMQDRVLRLAFCHGPVQKQHDKAAEDRDRDPIIDGFQVLLPSVRRRSTLLGRKGVLRNRPGCCKFWAEKPSRRTKAMTSAFRRRVSNESGRLRRRFSFLNGGRHRLGLFGEGRLFQYAPELIAQTR